MASHSQTFAHATPINTSPIFMGENYQFLKK